MYNNKEAEESDILSFPGIPEEQEYVIAYVDLLGTKAALEKCDGKNYFSDIYYAFLMAKNVMPKFEGLHFDGIKVKVFSDNILVAFPISNPESAETVFAAYRKICSFLRLGLFPLANKGVLFRGAITIGKMQINDLMVWGKGLSEAVYLEENIAIYPRMVLGEKLLKVFDTFSLDGVEYEEKFSCLKDFDGCVFFDIFDYNDIGNAEMLLENSQRHILEKIKNERNPKILQKLNWFKNYLSRAEEILAEVISLYD